MAARWSAFAAKPFQTLPFAILSCIGILPILLCIPEAPLGNKIEEQKVRNGGRLRPRSGIASSGCRIRLADLADKGKVVTEYW